MAGLTRNGTDTFRLRRSSLGRLHPVGVTESVRETSMNATRAPVLIVGAGVGGLAMSALLAKYGVSPLLVERRREVFIYPKARNISFRTSEILRRLGLGD